MSGFEENRNYERNPTHPWLRVILWILPAGFVVFGSALVSLLVGSFSRSEGAMMTVCVVVNILFLIGAGWCDYHLSAPVRKKSIGVGSAVVIFFFSQILLAPFILAIAVFAFCAVVH